MNRWLVWQISCKASIHDAWPADREEDVKTSLNRLRSALDKVKTKNTRMAWMAPHGLSFMQTFQSTSCPSCSTGLRDHHRIISENGFHISIGQKLPQTVP